MTTPDQNYDDWLLRTTSAAVAAGASTLRAVVERCWGADPVAVRKALMRSVRDFGAFEYLDAPFLLDEPVEPRLPAPHPLDYEWRFSRRGANTLLEVILNFPKPDVSFMGATTVAIAAARRGWEGNLVAIDQSRPVLQAAKALDLPITFILGDLSQHCPIAHGGSSDVVVVDPPWYLEYAQAFVLAAARECRIGGTVLASLPGKGTRPGVEFERSQLLDWARQVGLELSRTEPQAVAYETPHFEMNALRAAGLRGDLRSWRRGDLCIFKRVATVPYGSTVRVESLHEWREYVLDRTRIRFRTLGSRTGDTRLQRIVEGEGDILPTVSRRDPRRNLARVWTSGNRVFGCGDPDTLLTAVQARHQGLDELEAARVALGRPLSTVEQQSLRESCARLSDLMEQERDEQIEVTGDEERSERVTT